MPPRLQRDDEIMKKSARSCDPLIQPDVQSEEKKKKFSLTKTKKYWKDGLKRWDKEKKENKLTQLLFWESC